MARLPHPGGDAGSWGDILNGYLSVVHDPDGTLKDDSVGAAQLQNDAVTGAQIADGTITESLLDTALQTKLNTAAPVTSVNTKTGDVILDKSDVGLSNVDNNSDATKNAAVATLTNKTISGSDNTLSAIAQSSVTNLQSDMADKTNMDDFTATGWAVAQAADEAAARAAIGAAAATSSSSKTLAAGDNVSFTEDVSSVTVASRWGEPNVVTISLDNCNDLTVSTGTGNLRLVFFTPQKSGTFSGIKFFSGSTAAGATPTRIQVGVYSVDASDNITLIGSTPNDDLTLLSSTTTMYSKSFSSSVSLTAGSRYAVGLLVITAATAPTLYGHAMGSSTVASTGPGRRTALVAGQTVLLSSIANTSFSNSNAAIWFQFV